MDAEVAGCHRRWVCGKHGPAGRWWKLVHLPAPFIISASVIFRQHTTSDVTADVVAFPVLSVRALWQSTYRRGYDQHMQCSRQASGPPRRGSLNCAPVARGTTIIATR